MTDETFQREVIESELPVLVDMWAPWCQPCIAMKPTIRELSSELSGKAKVAELNIGQNPFIKEKYNVDKYPMLLIFADGIEVQRLVGTQGREELLEALSDHLASSYRQRRQR
ncbi:MAG: thiol reductase thioredoxin [Phycisphaera sp. RhM]|nr:thiol reductase thioredoxin [Phycisphaera sp. RhM]